MTGVLVAGSIVALLILLCLAARDAFRQTAFLGWTAVDDAQVNRLLDSGVDSLG